MILEQSDRSLFAIAVPIGSWHPFLPAALDSIAEGGARAQIALLDASCDPRVAEAADASGLSFAYLRHGPDQGQSDAIAEGWANTTAPILSWLNGDDRLSPNALAIAQTAFEADPDLDVFYGQSDFIDEAGRRSGRHDQVSPVSAHLLRSNTISQPSCFARRSAVEAVGGVRPELHYTMDWDLWIRLYKAGAKFEMTDRILSEVYTGRGTKTAQVGPRRLFEVGGLVERHAGLWAAVKSTLSLALHTVGQRSEPR